MEQINKDADLPPDVYLFPLQIAGHKHGEGRSKLGVLKHRNGNLLKPLAEGDARSNRELSFYENIYKNCDCDPDFSELVKYLPAFHGTLETKDMKYLCLEDVCENFRKPSVLDIKIGLKTHDPTATKEKVRLEEEKYPPAKILGFRILGMKVYHDAEKIYISKDKIFGRQLVPEDIISGELVFSTLTLGIFLTSNERLNCLILSGFIHKLVQLSLWFSKQRKFAFYGSSLLFVYEGITLSWTTWIQSNIMNIHSPQCDKANLEKTISNTEIDKVYFVPLCPCVDISDICDTCRLCKNVCLKIQSTCSLFRVVMIDFAHTFSSSVEDSNYIFGLNNLIQKLKDLLKLNLKQSCK